METPLTVLYTHRLRGDLDALPRLYSFLRQLRAYYTSEEVVQVCALDPARPPGRVLLLDLGECCDPAVWHCQVTAGRSMLVVLDGMGYDAARVDDRREQRAKLGDNVRLALIDGETPLRIDDLLLTVDRREERESGQSLQIVLTPADATRLAGDTLYLAALSGSQQVGAAQLTFSPRWTLAAHARHDLPRLTPPDPTIAASVEFVLSEARYAQKRRAAG